MGLGEDGSPTSSPIPWLKSGDPKVRKDNPSHKWVRPPFQFCTWFRVDHFITGERFFGLCCTIEVSGRV